MSVCVVFFSALRLKYQEGRRTGPDTNCSSELQTRERLWLPSKCGGCTRLGENINSGNFARRGRGPCIYRGNVEVFYDSLSQIWKHKCTGIVIKNT